MVKRAMTLGVVMILSLAVGCTTVQKWAAGGAVVGGTIGAVGGDLAWHGLNTVQSGLVGAAAGGLAGALVGDTMAQNEENKKCANALKDKDAQINEWQEKERQASRRLAAATADLEVKDREIGKLQKANADLTEELANCKGARVEITLTADVLFRPGSAVLSEHGKKALDEAAKQIKASGKNVMFEGHTVSDPIKASNWKTNWELGAARSLAVLHYLIDKGGVESAKLAAATYSQYQPVGKDKAKNRRAVIVLYSGWPSKRF
jgi:chemotaxis protein MotB